MNLPAFYWILSIACLSCLAGGCGREERGSERETVDKVEIKISEKSDTPAHETPVNSPMPDFSPPVEKPPEEIEALEQYSETELLELGIRVFATEHVRVLTDAVGEKSIREFAGLPEVVQQLDQNLRIFFPDAFGWQGFDEHVQITGHVMEDRNLFLQAGLLPEAALTFDHGIYQDQKFWMQEQKTDYYRRHLFIHEAMHCLMDQSGFVFPVWYQEGMAEMLAVHRMNGQGQAVFGVMPGDLQIQGGFGRLRLLRDEIQAGRLQTPLAIRQLDSNSFYPHKTSYAWSWALCAFLSRHPETAAGFKQLLTVTNRRDFNQRVDHFFPDENPRLLADWFVFASSLCPDYDFERTRIQWSSASRNDAGELIVQTNRGWQSGGKDVINGEKYQISASGEYELAQEPIPWISQPQGVSVEYVDGRPLGELQMVVFSEERSTSDYGFADVITVGQGITFEAKSSGQLFFRVNDLSSGFANNRGEVNVSIQKE